VPSPSRELARRRSGDHGAVTAEFALVLPAVFVVVAAAMAALGLATDAIRLADAAGIAARAAGRGDDAGVSAIVSALAPGSSVTITRGDLVCVRLAESAALGPVGGAVPLSSTSCAPDAGR